MTLYRSILDIPTVKEISNGNLKLLVAVPMYVTLYQISVDAIIKSWLDKKMFVLLDQRTDANPNAFGAFEEMTLASLI